MVDDEIEGRSLGEAEIDGSRSGGTFVRMNNASEHRDDLGERMFVVRCLYRMCMVLEFLHDGRGLKASQGELMV
jgi:hypothetical protein